MSEQKSASDVVRIPGQTRAATEAYQGRHRAVPAAAAAAEAAAPTVVPPAGILASQRKLERKIQRSVAPASAAAQVVPHQVPRVYDTPVWVPEAREGEEQHPVLVDDAADTAPGRPEGMIRYGRWTSSRGASVAAAFLLVGFLAEAVASGSGLLQRQSTPALAVTLGCLLGAAGGYALLVVLRPVVVELSDPWLAVRRGKERPERFNLASQFQEVQVSGRPGTRRWQLLLERPDGGVLRVGHRMVDSRSMDVVVRHAQAISARERAARLERFNL